MAVLAIGLMLCAGSFSLPLDSGEKTHFEVREDGSVHVDGLVFKDMFHYIQSDYFRAAGKRCGFDERRMAAGFKPQLPVGSQADCTTSLTVIKSEYYPSQTYYIPVVFHVIYKTDGTGNISNQRIQDQIDVLNEDYGALAGTMGANGYNTKIQFTLAGTTRTANNTWYNDSGELTYKAALAWNQNQYLNVYTNSASGYLGYAYLPQNWAGTTRDGVVMLHNTIGGRNNGYGNYDQGRTLVHEVGHYLGLEHTFAGFGCFNGYAAGDLIADTNSENTDHYGCTQTYTCGTRDMIENYMNYTDDTCMSEFTQEQANRMVCSLFNYRPNLATAGGADSITVTSPNGGESWTGGSKHSITWTSSGSVGNVKIDYSLNNGSTWTILTSSTPNDGITTWTLPNTTSSQCLVRIREASDGDPSDTSDGVFTITASGGGSPAISLGRSQLTFAAVISGAQTGSQGVLVDNSGSGTLSWNTSTSASWLNCSPSSGSGSGQLDISINAAGLSAGSYSGTVTVSDTNASNSPQTVTVNLSVINSGQEQQPFGTFTTPISGSTVNSSIPVTGWVLDDVGIQSVKIFRDGNIYIGDGVYVEGARPDVEQAYPDYPYNYQAGWGYMMLTNSLPNGGNGIFTLTVKATDVSGNTVTLGSKTITVDNNSAVKPFGAIDTPVQGGSASGSSFVNWGWVLTPLPDTVPTNGSTIDVWVDSVKLGNPTYNIYRSDIANQFPGYNNSNGAVGYFYLDTTAYSNGIHTIQWTATDDNNDTDGIGSRYFTILNTGNRIAQGQGFNKLRPGSKDFNALVSSLSVDNSQPVTAITGYNNHAARTLVPGAGGTVTVEIKELERLELRFPNATESLTRLPVGSAMDVQRGIFYWQPGAGFVGDYELFFLDKKKNLLKRIKIAILPKF
jgi:hypothetical protein